MSSVIGQILKARYKEVVFCYKERRGHIQNLNQTITGAKPNAEHLSHNYSDNRILIETLRDKLGDIAKTPEISRLLKQLISKDDALCAALNLEVAEKKDIKDAIFKACDAVAQDTTMQVDIANTPGKRARQASADSDDENTLLAKRRKNVSSTTNAVIQNPLPETTARLVKVGNRLELMGSEPVFCTWLYLRRTEPGKGFDPIGHGCIESDNFEDVGPAAVAMDWQ
ncbi:hypothetical protein C7974DRAFT_376000 [Boeremia exigua]|uniref:uncharacterized protein n=1 Tax=Boeremia exigua TaxID=749465 RepID=UPI001E8E01D2|nr:uncharacterized protein C7974DRAFT_376000 [Boeremia exigua]KAH6629118.1 hypothetical protein C7974DRAFT_376000 [Boeremia exigua]